MGVMPNEVLNWILRAEGGYVNNPKDPGGRTNKGITQGVLNNCHAAGLVAVSDVKDLTNEDVRIIYNHNYWLPSWSDKLPLSLALVHFDCSVNCGLGASNKLIRRAINKVSSRKVDEAADMCDDLLNVILTIPADDMIKAYLDVRMDYYKSIKIFHIFGKGWTNRLVNLAKFINVNWTPSI